MGHGPARRQLQTPRPFAGAAPPLFPGAGDQKEPIKAPARAGLYTVRAGPERSNGSAQASTRR